MEQGGGDRFLHPARPSFYFGRLQNCKTVVPGRGSPTPGPSGPQAVRAPGRANKANLACRSLGEGGPLWVELPAAPLGPQARGRPRLSSKRGARSCELCRAGATRATWI